MTAVASTDSRVEPATRAARANGLVELTTGKDRVRRRLLPRWLRRLVGPVILLVAWSVVSGAGLVDQQLFPGPVQVAKAAWSLIETGQLQVNLARSLLRVVEGTLLGIGCGLIIALAAGLTRFGEDLLDPVMQLFKAVPSFALTPLLIIWMGIGEAPKITLITVGVAIHIYINTYSGIRGVDRQLVEVAQTLRASRRELIGRVVLPGAMPNFLVGLRVGLSSAWLSLIFAESINATQGIGYLMSRAQSLLEFDVSLLIIFIYAVVGLLSYALVRFLERRLLGWRNEFQGV